MSHCGGALNMGLPSTQGGLWHLKLLNIVLKAYLDERHHPSSHPKPQAPLQVLNPLDPLSPALQLDSAAGQTCSLLARLMAVLGY